MPESSPNFLEKYVSLFHDTEVPQRFARWCGLSCISAMLERKIWLDGGIFTIYPNTYIILVAESGRCRKSTAIRLTKKLLRNVDPGPRLIAQKITPEAMIETLKTYKGPSKDMKEILRETCGGVVLCDELMTFLNKDSYERGLGGLLIPFYDCEDKFEYASRGHGKEEIHFAHLSILGASTIHSLRDAVPLKALGDGLSSRVLFVYTNEVPNPVPWPEFSEHKKQTEEELIHHLQAIATLKGPVRLSPDARKFHDEEYCRYYYTSTAFDDPSLRAYATRRDIHLLKVAMCLMVCENPTMEITRQNLMGAKFLLEDIEPSMSTVFEQILTTDTGTLIESVFSKISVTGENGITRSELLRMFAHRIDAKEFSKLTETLVASSRISVTTEQGAVLYKVTQKD